MKTAVATRISQYLDSHEYPSLFYRYPFLVLLIQWFNTVIILRNWYVRKELHNVLEPIKKDASMLDAGCGLGDFALYCAKSYPALTVVGIDSSLFNVQLAESLRKRVRLDNVRFERADLLHYRPEPKFDTILCSAVLQSIEDDRQALRSISGALKTGGYLLLYTPIRYKRFLPFFAELEDAYLDRFFYSYNNGFSHHRYSAQDVITKVQTTGLTIEHKSFSHGVCGAIAFELYSLFLIILKRCPSFLLFVLVPLYGLLLFPIQMILMAIDYFVRKTDGNGLLIVARKD